MAQWEQIVATSSTSGLRSFLVFLWGELEELQKKFDSHSHSHLTRDNY